MRLRWRLGRGWRVCGRSQAADLPVAHAVEDQDEQPPGGRDLGDVAGFLPRRAMRRANGIYGCISLFKDVPLRALTPLWSASGTPLGHRGATAGRHHVALPFPSSGYEYGRR
jgi:hypothetical protein